jgi:hypothetical protein
MALESEMAANLVNFLGFDGVGSSRWEKVNASLSSSSLLL